MKRVDLNREGWQLVSDNPAWLPMRWPRGTEIVGRVRWMGRTF